MRRKCRSILNIILIPIKAPTRTCTINNSKFSDSYKKRTSFWQFGKFMKIQHKKKKLKKAELILLWKRYWLGQDNGDSIAIAVYCIG